MAAVISLPSKEEDAAKSVPQMTVASLAGVHSACFNTVLASASLNEMDIPIGNAVTRWDIESKSRVFTQQLHSALMSDLKMAPMNIEEACSDTSAASKCPLVASVSHDREFKIWKVIQNEDTSLHYECIAQSPFASIDGGPVSRVEWSLPLSDHSYYLVTLAQDEDFSFNNVLITLWKLSVITSESEEDGRTDHYTLNLLCRKQGDFRYAFFNAMNDLIIVRTHPTNTMELHKIFKVQSDDDDPDDPALPPSSVFTMRFQCSLRESYGMDSWNCACTMDSTRSLIICATKINKSLLFIDALSLRVLLDHRMDHISPNLWTVHILDPVLSPSSVIRFCLFPSDGLLEVWSVDTQHASMSSRVTSVGNLSLRGKYRFGGEGFTYVISHNDQWLWDVSSDGLYAIDLEALGKDIADSSSSSDETTRLDGSLVLSVEHHSIACCGIDVIQMDDETSDSSHSRFLVATGDLGCNLIVWDMAKDGSAKAIVKHKTVMSVRSVKWINGLLLIFVGCLDGSLLCCDINGESKESLFLSESVEACESPVNCIECLMISLSRFILLVGTSSGHCRLIEMSYDPSLSSSETTHTAGVKGLSVIRTLCFLAHPAVDTESRGKEYKEQFGSLHKSADVWNVCFRDEKAHSGEQVWFASVSEDQSTRVWKWQVHSEEKTALEMPDEKEVLRGHSSAVTCVDWVVSSEIREDRHQEYLVSCADDRTVMLWGLETEEEGWQLIHHFGTGMTREVLGWFTFTYLRWIPSLYCVIAVTQNGYFVLLDVRSLKIVQSKSIHRGSIEGLRVIDQSAFACASDGTVSMVNVE